MGKVTWEGWSKPGGHIPQKESIIFGEQLKPKPPAKSKQRREPPKKD
jgi:hypothetical protein